MAFREHNVALRAQCVANEPHETVAQNSARWLFGSIRKERNDGADRTVPEESNVTRLMVSATEAAKGRVARRSPAFLVRESDATCRFQPRVKLERENLQTKWMTRSTEEVRRGLSADDADPADEEMMEDVESVGLKLAAAAITSSSVLICVICEICGYRLLLPSPSWS